MILDVSRSEEAEWLSKAETSGVRGKVKYYTCPQCREAQDRLKRGKQGTVLHIAHSEQSSIKQVKPMSHKRHGI